MDIGILTEIGLTQGESKVYTALLGLGQSTVGPIVKQSGVTTSKTYQVLARLEKKGLVSHIYKNKVRHFKAASPENVLELVETHFKRLKAQREKVKALIPQLVSYQKHVQAQHEAEVYYGVAGLETLFAEELRELKENDEHHVIGIAPKEAYSSEVVAFFRRLQLKRGKKGIISNFLFSEEARGSFDYIQPSSTCRVKYIPHASLVSINIHGNTTIIGVFVGEPILFKISSSDVADSFRKQFSLLWEHAKE